MARSTMVCKWVTQIHGLLKVVIKAEDADPEYISSLSLVEEANAEYTNLVSADQWGAKRKPDQGVAPKHFT